jgi:hypothetical protein
MSRTFSLKTGTMGSWSLSRFDLLGLFVFVDHQVSIPAATAERLPFFGLAECGAIPW